VANHGYVVAALDHPYDTAAVVFADDCDPGSYDQPVLALTQQIGLKDNPQSLPHLGQGLERSTTTGYLLTIPGTAHPTFTDAAPRLTLASCQVRSF